MYKIRRKSDGLFYYKPSRKFTSEDKATIFPNIGHLRLHIKNLTGLNPFISYSNFEIYVYEVKFKESLSLFKDKPTKKESKKDINIVDFL